MRVRSSTSGGGVQRTVGWDMRSMMPEGGGMLEPMLAALLFAALVAGVPALPPPAPTAVPTIPDEPGAFMLPEAPTYQAVAADLDDDGANEIVRLVRGERVSIHAEVWREDASLWVLAWSYDVV